MERTWYELVLIPLETAFYSEAKKKICYIAYPDSKQKTREKLRNKQGKRVLEARYHKLNRRGRMVYYKYVMQQFCE